MATTPEGKVKSALKKRLKELGVLNTGDALNHLICNYPSDMPHRLCQIGGWYYMPSTNGYGEAGVWDFVGAYDAKFFAIETKAGKNTLSPHQKIKGRIFQACSVLRYVVSSVDEAERFCFEESPQYQP